MDRKSDFAPVLFFLVCSTFCLLSLFPSVGFAKTVTLGWDANPEPDLEGYVIYRNTGSSGPPYKHSDELPEYDLADPLHPKVTLTGIKEDREYYIALTAYNTDGVESGFSDEICVEMVEGVVELCSQSTPSGGSTSSGSGGGGGVGCFISSTAGDFAYAPAALRAVLIAGMILGAARPRKNSTPVGRSRIISIPARFRG